MTGLGMPESINADRYSNYIDIIIWNHKSIDIKFLLSADHQININ